MRSRLFRYLSLVTMCGSVSAWGHPGHDAGSPMAWMGLGKHREDHTARHQGYLAVSKPSSLRFQRASMPFDRARVIPLNSIVRNVAIPEPEAVELLPPPPPIEEEEMIEILITEPEVVEVEDMPEPIVQEDINSMYNEAGMLNPDDILLYLRDFEPEGSTGDNSREVGGAFRFQLPTNTPPIRGDASLERSP